MASTYAWDDLMWAESVAIADLLDELPDEELDRPSLCDGWAVRDVVGHMLFGHTTPLGTVLGQLARYRFDLAKASAEKSRELARSLSPAELRAQWREVATKHTRRGAAKLIRTRDGFVDHTIHHQDIRRGVGRPRTIAPERLTAALDGAVAIVAPTFSPKKKVKGLRLEATDIGWSHGDGPVVRGPGEALLMAAAGRKAALADLDGDGVATLAARLGA